MAASLSCGCGTRAIWPKRKTKSAEESPATNHRVTTGAVDPYVTILVGRRTS